MIQRWMLCEIHTVLCNDVKYTHNGYWKKRHRYLIVFVFQKWLFWKWLVGLLLRHYTSNVYCVTILPVLYVQNYEYA